MIDEVTDQVECAFVAVAASAFNEFVEVDLDALNILIAGLVDVVGLGGAAGHVDVRRR